MNRILYFFLILSFTIISCGRKSLDDQFYDDAIRETQQMCPRTIDDCTTLDSIVFDKMTRTQYYYYTFSGNMDNENLYTDNFRAEIFETLLKSLRNEIKLKKQMEAEINFGYVYMSSSSKKQLIRLFFGPKDYSGPLKIRSFNERITGKWEDYTLRNCPEQQDDCTTLEEVFFDSINKVVDYKFILKGELDIDSLNEQYPDARKELKKMLIKGIRTNESLTEENDSNVDYHVSYWSKSTKKKLIDIDITSKEI